MSGEFAVNPDPPDTTKTFTYQDFVTYGTKDLPYEQFKSFNESINNQSFEKFDKGFYFPIVFAWFEATFASLLTDKNYSNDIIIELNNRGHHPINFSRTIDHMIRVRFTDNVLNDFDSNLTGIQLFTELYNAYSKVNFETLERILLLKHVMKNIITHGSNYKEFNNHVTIMQYYFDHFNSFTPYFAMFNVPPEQIDTVLNRKQLTTYTAFEGSTYRNLIKLTKKLDKIKNIETEQVNYVKFNKSATSNSDNASNDNISKKVRCYICHKLGHTGPQCVKYDPSKDKRRFESVQYVEIPAQSNVWYGLSNETMVNDAEEVFIVQDIPFILDSGSTCHLVNDETLLENILESNTYVKGIDNVASKVKQGDLTIGNLTLHDVKVYPKSDKNIISGDLLTKLGYNINLNHKHATISKDNQLILKAIKKNRFWEITPSDFKNETVLKLEETNLMDLHVKNGHASPESLKGQFPKLNLSELRSTVQNCLICASQVKLSHGPTKDDKPTSPGSYVSADIFGPNNGQYGLILGDRHTGFLMGYILQSKAEASDKLIVLLKRMNNILSFNNHSIIHLRTDNEFNTNKIINFCEQNGIILENTAPHSSFQNGVSEKNNQIVQNKIKLMIATSNVHTEYWSYAFYYAIYLNNSITKAGNTLTPFEQIRSINLQHNSFPAFGCLCYLYNYNKYPNKVFHKNFSGVFLGYEKSSKIAKVLTDDGIIRTTSAFKTVDNIFPFANNYSHNNGLNITNNLSKENSSFSYGNSTVIGNNNSFNVLAGLDEDTEMDDASLGSNNTVTKETIQSNNGSSAFTNSNHNSVNSDSVSSGSISPEEIVPKDYILDASINALNFNKQKTKLSNVPTAVPFSNSSNSSVDTQGDTIMKDFHTSTPNKKVIIKSPESTHDYIVEDITDQKELPSNYKQLKYYEDDPLNALEKQIVHQSKQSKPDRTTDSPDPIDVIDESLSRYFSNNSEQSYLLMPSTTEAIPKDYAEVLKSKSKDNWELAMKMEIESLRKHEVYTESKEKIQKENIISSKWVFTLKNMNGLPVYKARLVCKGFTQMKGINFNTTYSPVSSYDSFRTLLAIHTQHPEHIMVQIDVKTAFLHSELSETIFVKPPPGSGATPGSLWKLHKSLYGLKQAPSNFFKTFSKVLKLIGLNQSTIEPCTFYNTQVKMVIYVDDGMLFGPKTEIDKILKRLNKYFELKITQNPSVFLGMTITKLKGHSIKLSLKDYLEKVKQEHDQIQLNFKHKTPLPTDYDPFEQKSEKLDKEKVNEYQKVMGIINYTVSTVRMDIAYASSILSRKLKSPTKQDLKMSYRVLNYLINTKEFGITYKNNQELNLPITQELFMREKKPQNLSLPENNEIKVVTDASWADDKSYHSNYGYVTFINNNMISFKSKKIGNITLSTSESELVGICEGTKNGLFIRNFLQEMNLKMEPLKVINDNMSAISSADHYTSKNKHINIKVFFTRELVDKKEIQLFYVQSENNLADTLTKSLDKNAFFKLTNQIIN